MEQKQVTLNLDFINVLLAYLRKQPWEESNEFIQHIVAEGQKQLSDAPPEPKKAPK